MHLILTGPTGLVGSATLHAMLRNPSITRITLFSRSPVAQATDSDSAKSKCTVHTHPDFSTPPAKDILTKLRGEENARGTVWALGVSQNNVDAAAYDRITVDWPVAWARAFAEATPAIPDGETTTPHFNFVYISGEGATLTPGFMTSRYGRVKGIAERSLLDLQKFLPDSGLRVYSSRPGAVDRAGHKEIEKYALAHEGMQKKLEAPVRAVLRVAYKPIMSPTWELGKVLVKLASGDGERLPEGEGVSGEGRTLGNAVLRRLGGL